MALISCHVLDSVYGKNAAHIGVQLVLNNSQILFQMNADTEGRIKTTFEAIEHARYQLIFNTGLFLEKTSSSKEMHSIIPEVSINFCPDDVNAHYHFSIAFTPGSFSVVSVVNR